MTSSNGEKLMTFAKALERAINGARIRRLTWEDRRIYVAISNNKLVIYRPDTKQIHPLTVTIGDIIATDWVVVKVELVH